MKDTKATVSSKHNRADAQMNSQTIVGLIGPTQIQTKQGPRTKLGKETENITPN